jgi:hypothetical protein
VTDAERKKNRLHNKLFLNAREIKRRTDSYRKKDEMVT